MSDKSSIEWTDATWNPLTGCTRVSAGCDHCYAYQLHDQRHAAWKRGRMPDAAAQYHKPFSQVQLLPERLTDPIRWRKPKRIFVASMGDPFHPDVPDEYLDAMFGIMAVGWWHTYQLLTKRIDRASAWFAERYQPSPKQQALGRVAWESRQDRVTYAFEGPLLDELTGHAFNHACVANPKVYNDQWGLVGLYQPWPLPNVWIGTSVENQEAADERIPHLLQTPAAVRFLSCEPLLGEVSIERYLWLIAGNTAGPYVDWAGKVRRCGSGGGGNMMSSIPARDLHWVIAGGESGPHHRPLNLDNARTLRDQCVSAGIPFFFKQIGGRTPKAGGRVLDGRTWDEYPPEGTK